MRAQADPEPTHPVERAVLPAPAPTRSIPPADRDAERPWSPILVPLLRRPWLWPSALTLALTLLQADRAQLWRDELATWSAASRPPADLLRMLGNIDAVSGPYYLLMSGWIRVFGDSVIALRLPSALAMMAAAGLTAVLGARVFNERVGMVAGLLFAVVPSTSRYGQEARSYALVTLLAVGATLLLLRALERPTWTRWAAYAGAVAGLGLAHLVAVTLVAAHAVAVGLAWHRGDRRPLGWMTACGSAGTVLAPLALFSRGQQAQQLGWVRSPTISAVVDLPGGITQAAAVGGLLAGFAAVAAVNTGRRGATLAACLLFPSGALLAASLVSPLWVPRYLVFTVPFGCLLSAAALATTGLRTTILVTLLVAVLGAPAQASLRRTHEPTRSHVDYRAAVRVVVAHDRPGDAIAYSGRGVADKMLETAVAYLARGDRPHDVLAVRDPVRSADLEADECAEPARCLAGTARVWLLVPGHRADPLQRLPAANAAALRDAFRVEQTWRVPGLTVALLTRTS
ncbi:MAG TPA: glycosyltransferase family 39 protein [Micromonosporaceae bacterium]|nr:glycosyltransferase family 39 protein [Micromonosporaceae bacterium]